MAAYRWNGSAWVDATGTKKRWDGANWIDLAFGRRWNGTQWIELWGANAGNPVNTGDGSFFVFNDNETIVAFTEDFVFNATNTMQGF
jgi:hypothetical protein